jgi:RimJ/RimL family protein N-acetyltransferase
MTQPIVLRPLLRGDVREVFAAVRESYAELSRWMAWCTPDYDEAGVAAYVEHANEQRQAGVSFEFGIFSTNGEFLGNCGLNDLNRENKFANLGYWIRTPRTRQGIATTAVHELARWGFSNTDLNRFEIVVAVDNLASQRVAERAGAVREGVLRRRLVLRGRAHDAVVYSILRGAPERI